MNFILCNEKCRHQKDGYCSLEGAAQVTNALASPCRYCEATESHETQEIQETQSPPSSSFFSSIQPQGDEHDQRS